MTDDNENTEEKEILKKLEVVSEELEKLQISVAESFSFREITEGSVKTFRYPIFMKMKQGEDLTTEIEYSDAVYQYIASISIIINSKLENLHRDKETDISINTERVHFLRIAKNSLDSLRTGGEEIGEFYNQFVVKIIKDNLAKYNYICLGVLGVMIIGILIIMPVTISTASSDQDVLALFGMVSLLDIQEISDSIHKFKHENIDEYIDDDVLEEIIDKDSDYQEEDDDDIFEFESEVMDNSEDDNEIMFEDGESDEDIGELKRNLSVGENQGEVINTEYDQLTIRQENPVKHTVRGTGYQLKSPKKEVKEKEDLESQRLNDKNRRKRSKTENTIKKKKFVKKKERGRVLKKKEKNILNKKMTKHGRNQKKIISMNKENFDVSY